MHINKSHGYDGLLIVIEGTDGSGKSTQVNMLSKYIQDKCFGCTVSQWKTSRLISGVINEAKEKNMLNTTTFSLLYAADYTDRLENEIIPALKAGWFDYFAVNMPDLVVRLNNGEALSDEDKALLKEKFIEFKSTM